HPVRHEAGAVVHTEGERGREVADVRLLVGEDGARLAAAAVGQPGHPAGEGTAAVGGQVAGIGEPGRVVDDDRLADRDADDVGEGRVAELVERFHLVEVDVGRQPLVAIGRDAGRDGGDDGEGDAVSGAQDVEGGTGRWGPGQVDLRRADGRDPQRRRPGGR